MPICASMSHPHRAAHLAHRRAAVRLDADALARRALVELMQDHLRAGEPPARAPPLRRIFWIAQFRLASTGVVVVSRS